MRRHHVGDLVVVDEVDGKRLPAGIVTDRVIVMEIVAMGLDASVMTVGDFMEPKLATVDENEGIYETMLYMRTEGVRRLPVVDRDGALVGIVTLDDLIELLADEMSELAKLVSSERMREEHARR